jgi:thioredoxin reductase
MAKRLIVIGAGPIGIEAALGAIEKGFDVTVLEKGRPGDALRRWGSTRFFSPFGMNVSRRLTEALGPGVFHDDALLTGVQFADQVLEPLVHRAPLEGRVRIDHRVIGVGRARMTRAEMPGHPVRAERPFRVLVEHQGREEVLEAERVLDASGVHDRPLSLGAGGMLAPGERTMSPRLIRHLGTLQTRLWSMGGARILLVGHGHSAANAIALLDQLGRADRGTRITWAVKTAQKRPCIEVASDPLHERREAVERANRLAEDPPPYLRVERRAQVESLEDSGGAVRVRFTQDREGCFDEIVSLTGYRPDLSFLSELTLDISPVSEGVAGIQRALANVADCLSAPSLTKGDLASGEPGFHLVGSKSYGRMPSFLLRTGLQHLEQILEEMNR